MSNLLSSYLAPPGSGVFTVSTGSDIKRTLHQRLYQTENIAEVNERFRQSLASLSEIPSDKVALLGICSDNGGGVLRGANWGPLFIREEIYNHAAQNDIVDIGDIRIIPHLLHDKYLNDTTIAHCRNALYGQQNDLAVSPLSITEETLDYLYGHVKNFKVFALGGDHSVSYPLVKSYLKAKQNKKIALVHFDAHTDLLKERLGIDICFGSWLTHVLPGFTKPDYVTQFGIRATGKPKSHWEQEFGIRQYWAEEINERGICYFVEQTLNYYQAEGIEELYISFDIDALDARFASATGTAEAGGLSLDDACFAIHAIAETIPVTGADLVEVAPFIKGHPDVDEPATTLHSAERISEQLINAMKYSKVC